MIYNEKIKEVKALDTYWHTDFHCTKCGACIEACNLKGKQWLTIFQTTDYDGYEEVYIGGMCDYVPCHHCDGFWENKTPCQKVCKNNAIKISRL